MDIIEKAVAHHYGDANLVSRILNELEASGIDLQQLKPDDLMPVEYQ